MQTVDWIDPARIGIRGTSFRDEPRQEVEVAAPDRRVRCVVSLAGHPGAPVG